MNIPEALKRLDDLPTADAIADQLVSMGVGGIRMSPTKCAIAVYLWSVTGERVRVGLARETSDGLTTRSPLSTEAELHSAPRVAQFIRGFDNGSYPKLDG